VFFEPKGFFEGDFRLLSELDKVARVPSLAKAAFLWRCKHDEACHLFLRLKGVFESLQQRRFPLICLHALLGTRLALVGAAFGARLNVLRTVDRRRFCTRRGVLLDWNWIQDRDDDGKVCERKSFAEHFFAFKQIRFSVGRLRSDTRGINEQLACELLADRVKSRQSIVELESSNDFAFDLDNVSPCQLHSALLVCLLSSSLQIKTNPRFDRSRCSRMLCVIFALSAA